ncbi:NUDIX hydrolase [Nocardioides albus]|uniref:8-oxo-dGTP pyrophosphatase MutT (NUDIX family) n=1 Tax=Nocardioides albus TaxID=1841 RepID=A0A7W5FAG4_9ACTN|nr:NUDIX domain-containing protein [Nocardioides albus]MBB3091121.1 8-oxo-dGTP pyrophosphatase MutT (NUDIX family) [Nocardioides albus]GGU34206.1 NUDIX hydrolase [Nocardioides albus]
MGRRIDWYDDPAAPDVNSIKPSAGAFVRDDAGRILLIRRDDNGNWSMPGGAMDPGESLTDCAIRETLEETGIEVAVTDLVGIWTDPLHRIEYTSDGEVRQEFTIIYAARYVAGEPTPSKESLSVEWVDPDKVSGLQMDRSQRVRIDWALSGRWPHIDQTSAAS